MTYIYQTMNTNQVASALLADEHAGWTYEAASTLADYLEQLVDDIGEPIELDVVAIRCEWCFDDADQIAANYGLDVSHIHDDERYQAIREALQDNTTVIELSNNQLLYICY